MAGNEKVCHEKQYEDVCDRSSHDDRNETRSVSVNSYASNGRYASPMRFSLFYTTENNMGIFNIPSLLIEKEISFGYHRE